MNYRAAPKGMRLHIGIFGRRNVGKSSLLNAITRQQVSIVSPVAGTTTDPVEKPMELLPIGPVLFIDTAGIDDEGDLGELRVSQSHKAFERTEVALLITDGTWTPYDAALLDRFKARQCPVILIANKHDTHPVSSALQDVATQHALPLVHTVAPTGAGLANLREALVAVVPAAFLAQPTIVADLVPPGEMAILVVPIDKEAPKGRLIMPQVQSIRDLLDNDAMCLVVKERELRAALERLRQPPALVVTDSQAFLKVAADTPPSVPLTSFSILFARYKGDLLAMTAGALAIAKLKSGDRILIAEACSHHPIGEDIGQVKIPRWLSQYVGGKLHFQHCQGRDFPEDLSPYALVIHCGACTWNRQQVLARVMRCQEAGVPITNYGMAIAFSLGILQRALAPFPAAHAMVLAPSRAD